MSPANQPNEQDKLPSLASLATRAIRQLSKRAVILTVVICSVITFTGVLFLIRPLEARLSQFSDSTRKALSERNQELVRSSVEQAANNMVRLLGSAEMVIEQLSETLQAQKLSTARTLPPVERDFFPGGKYQQLLGAHDGYQDKVTFDLPQLKTNSRSDLRRIAPLWNGFFDAAKEFHSYHSELKWLYLGTDRGSFLVFPASPEIPSGYDPRTRPWYQEARSQNGKVWTSPYFTAGGNDLVLTVAQPLKRGLLRGSVVGVDVVMSDVINNLLATPYCEHCTFYLLNSAGEILGKKGDKSIGDTWTNLPKARNVFDDLKGFLPIDVANSVVTALSQKPDLTRAHPLSRIPKAVALSGGRSDYAFYSAPIDILGWRLLGVASKTDPGADGMVVLDSVSRISKYTRVVALLLAGAIICVAAFLFWAYSLLARAVLRRSLQPSIDQLVDLGQSLDQLKIDPAADLPVTLTTETSLFRERSKIVEAIRRMQIRLRKEKEEHERLQVQAELGTQARLVAHNIRSPLESLEMALPYLKDAPDEKVRIIRSAVKEIRDLANTVKAKGRGPEQTLAGATQASPERSIIRPPQLLITLLESVVSERRNAFPGIDVSLTSQSQTAGFGAFVSVDTTELKCLLANIINNAAEAVFHKSGMVLIDLSQDVHFVTIRVTDNGPGITSEVLGKLGTTGATFGKPEGSGLGIHHAKTTLASWGGSFEITSETSKGTTVSLHVPKAQAPRWFASAVSIPESADIAVIDDDVSIHATWDFKLAKSTGASNRRANHFYDGASLKDWSTSSRGRAIYLVDYEIRGDKQNGLDLIEELKIAEHSYLVTGSHDQTEVLARAEWLGVKVLPKELLGSVPVSFS